jgi:hypothetical protein
MAETDVLTREGYSTLTPYQQGYVTYMRGDWPDVDIPKENPYPAGSADCNEWSRGNFMAMLHTQDSEE